MRIKLGKTPLREAGPRRSAMREVVERGQCRELLRMIIQRNGRPPAGSKLLILATKLPLHRGLEYHVVYCYDMFQQSHLDWVCDVATNYPDRWDGKATQALAPWSSCLER